MPQFNELKELGENLAQQANAYRQAGDTAAAESVWQLGLSLSQQLNQTPAQSGLLQDLTSLAIESQMLGTMNPTDAFGSTGQTVQSQLAELARQSAAIQDLARQEEGLLQGMSEQDLANFFERVKVNGEQAALQWARSKYGSL
jgi:hypothetical protein